MAKREALDPSAPGGPGQALLDALRRLLRPLVRLMIARSVPFTVVTEILRTLYVEVAEDDFGVGTKRQTDSRIHLLTGVHRKDVRRLRAERAEATSAQPRKASLTSLLIARWTTLEEYRDENGRPRSLPRVGDDAASFESLVRSVNTDIRPRVILDEWLRLGLATVEGDAVHLNVEAFVPPKGSDELLFFFGRNLHDHIGSAVANVLGEGEPMLERSAAYDQLSPDSVAELRALAAERGMQALREVNTRAMALQRRDAGGSDATARMSFGAYFFAETERKQTKEPKS